VRKKGTKFAALILALAIFISASPTAIAADSQRMIMAYLYMGPNESPQTAGEKFKTQVMATVGTVDIVAPNWLDVTDSAGTVVDTTNQSFIDWAHTQGIRVTPMVSKKFSSGYIQTVLASPALRTKLINNLLSKVDKYGYDGLNLDFEGAGLEPFPGALTAFVQELANGLHKRGKLATIAVMPKTGPNTPGWLGEYDYPALGKMVDYVIIMAYDQSWEGSPPGPVAGLDWVSRSMSYAVSAIDPQKVIMGAPLYGRRWKDDKGGRGVSYAYAQQLLTENNGTLLWNDSAKTPYFSVRDAQGVNQVVYFENQLSLQHKMDYAAELKVAGAAFWRLGFEDPSWWPDLDLHLQGLVVGEQPPADNPPVENPPVDNPPSNSGGVSRGDEAVLRDISRHWAKNDIMALAAKKIITGFPDGTFKPELAVTREQLAIMLARALELRTPQQKSGLTEVPANYQYADYIYAAKSAGIINGYADQTFRPAQNATRAEAAKMLTTALALPATTSDLTAFKDVAVQHWAAPHIAALKTAGITNGFADGNFQPEATTTRAQVAKFLNQALALKK
jgi:spore germination protein YaaH